MLRRAGQSLMQGALRRQGQVEPLMEGLRGPAVQSVEG